MHRYLLLKQFDVNSVDGAVVVVGSSVCIGTCCLKQFDVNSVDGAVVVVGSSVCIGTCC